MIMEALHIALYIVTIVSATVCWCLAAAFLALTNSHLDRFWRGDVALLVFGILAMLFLPFLAWFASRRHPGNLTGPAIAECITVFIFWAIFLAATAKFSSSYHTATGWSNRCRIGFSMCGTGRALLAFGWITFGLLSALLLTVIAHAVLSEKERKSEQRQGGNFVDGPGTSQVEPTQNAPVTPVKQNVGGIGGTGANQLPQAQV
ncbi:hypothetical protein JCM3765_007114 [Sporobolomyces pararoseus]